jgi:hypothetical protein
MPRAHKARALLSLERRGRTNQAEIFQIFQYVTRKILPIGRQEMPPARMRRQISATVGAGARHRRGSPRADNRNGKNAVVTRTHAVRPARATRDADDLPIAVRELARDDFALGNFFRIIVFDVIRFFVSVSRYACNFETGD